MLSKIKIAMLSLAAFSMLFVVGCEEDEPTVPGAELSQIRVIHTSYDAPNVDVQLDGESAITDLGYGQSSGYASVEAGTRSVTVTPTGATSPQVISENLPLEEGEVYSIFAVDSLSAISAIFTAEDKSAVQGEAKIRFVHASPDAPAVDIRTGSATGSAVFSDAAFKDISDYITVAPDDYMFVVTPAGVEEEVVAFDPVGLEAGQVYTVVAHGTLDETDNVPFAVRVFIDNGAGDQFVDLTAAPTTSNLRVIHTSYDAPNVDVALDGTTAFTDLAYGMSSGYAEVDFGTRNVVVTPTGAATPEVINADVELMRGMDYTVFAMDALANIGPVVANDMREPASGMAKVRFVHASPDAPAVDIKVGTGAGTAVFSNAAFEDVTDYAEVDAGEYAFVVTATGSTDEVVAFQPQGLAAGEVYTVVAHGTLDDTDSYPFAVRVFIDSGTGDQYVDLTVDPQVADLRVIHTSYDAPNVDVSLDGAIAISDLAYGESSGYAEVAAGTRTTVVTPAGQSTPEVINADIPLMRGMDYTVFAMDDLANITAVVENDMREPVSGEAKIRFVHASPDAPAVDIKVGTGSGTAVFADEAFTDVSDYTTVTPGDYSFVVTPTGSETEVVVFDPVTVDAGMVYTVVAHGTLDDSDAYPFAVRVFVDNNPGDAYVDLTPATSDAMVIHASPDAPGVDLYVDGTLINSGAPLEYPDNTSYLSLTSGTRNIMVNATGTETTVIDANVTFRQDSSYSIFAVNDVNNIEPLVVMDDLTTPASGNGHVRFLHLSPDAPAVDITLDDGTVVFADYSFKEYSAFTPLSAGDYDLQVRAAGTSTVVLDLDPITVTDGMIYTIFAKGFLSGTGDEALGAEIIMNN